MQQAHIPPKGATSVAQTIARHFFEIRYEDIPADAIQMAKLTILDTLAVALAALDAEGVAEARATALAGGGASQGRVWGMGAAVPVQEAAFANGVAAAALDYDALHVEATVHADIVALPALLAVADYRHCSGKDLLAAHVVSVDLIARLGLSAPGHSGWFYSSIFGVFGAAAGAARLLGLPAEQIAHALGLALPGVGGTQQAMLEQSQLKRLQGAFAARHGVHAALLAANGIRGVREVFEGRFGLFSLYEHVEPGQVLDQLGSRWENVHTGIKKFPNCACAHAPLEAALTLVRLHDIAPEEIQAVEVVLTPYAHRLVGAVYDPYDNPQVAAQFSVQYAIATALLRRRFGLADIAPAQALEERAIALARRIVVRVDDREPGRLAPAGVSIDTLRGTFRQVVDWVPGDRTHPLTQQQVVDKAEECLGLGPAAMDARKAAAFIDRVLNLETLPDTNALW